MTLEVVFRRAARTEFDAAALWYDERQKGLGPRFTLEVDGAIALAARNPERFPAKHAAIRCVQVRRFPCAARSGRLAIARLTANKIINRVGVS